MHRKRKLIHDTQVPVQKLVLGPLPIDCFTSRGIPFTTNRLRQESLQNAVTNIEDLQVKVQQLRMLALGLPVVNSIGLFFGSMCNLRSLKLTGDTETTLFPRTKLSMTFCRIVWPHLETFRLSGIRANEIELLPFLFKHSITFRRLHLSNNAISFPDSSHKDILTILKDQLELQNLEYLVEDRLERPRDEDLHRPIYDIDWKLTQSSGSSIPNAKLLEMYVQGKSLWPMADDSPNDYMGWVRLPVEELIVGLVDASSIDIGTLLEDEWDSDSYYSYYGSSMSVGGMSDFDDWVEETEYN
ncbi:hypothetical protein G7Y89_g13696 [Cudoniella acicularis]|uniref:Uncharacterized protein n=1 Tax=Cudoniella acicularis TaxID=354080 RepID=A0A8H4R916_9HELO|nr:hypothetical protein G7Y89_g13696 [Cudoniella acicularis]